MKFTPSLLAIAAISLWIPSGSAQRTLEPDFTASGFRATAMEKSEELELVECDRRADQAKVPHSDRMAFIERCLQAKDQPSKQH
jgi:hypothetical protein